MRKETIFLLVEQDAETADYSLHKEEPQIIPEGYEIHSADITHMDVLQTFVLANGGSELFGIFRLFTDEDSLAKFVGLVGNIEGYTKKTMLHLLFSVFEGESIDRNPILITA